MGETYGLGVAHIEPVRRIATRVAKSSGAGRYFAIGKSEERRERVEGALRSLIGDAARVVTLDMSENDQDPWNWINDRAREEPSGKVLFCVRGLGEMVHRAEAAGRPNPYAQLNFARDAWGSMGRHVLIWLDGLEAFDAFLLHAPDLWSHRDVVGWFLTRADFAPAEGPAVRDRVAEEIEQARKELEEAGSTEQRALSAMRLATRLREHGEAIAALEATEVGLQGLPGVDRSGAIRASTLERAAARSLRARLFGSRAPVLADLARSNQAASELGWAIANDSEWPDWQRQWLAATAHTVERRWRPEKALPSLTSWLAQYETTNASLAESVRSNLAHSLCLAGRVREAETAQGSDRSVQRVRAAWNRERKSVIASARGDYSAAFRAAELANRAFQDNGRLRVRGPRLKVAAILEAWGDAVEADRLVRTALEGDAGSRILPLIDLFLSRWRRASPLAADTLADLLRDIATLTAHSVARAVAADACSTLLDTLETDAEPTDSFLPTLESTLRSIQRAAKADSDHEVDGWTRWSLARLALLRGDPKRAYSLADGHLIKWCHRWRGLIAESEIWGLLARSAPTLALALEHLARALKAADESPSLYAQIAARRVAAQVHVRASSLPAAVTALQDARAVARSEGLRPKELDLLHDLAELPGYTDARAAAREALALAEAMALPREEARALLNILEIARRAGEPLSARRLDRASEIVEELGPPRLRTRVRAFAATAQANGSKLKSTLVDHE